MEDWFAVYVVVGKEEEIWRKMDKAVEAHCKSVRYRIMVTRRNIYEYHKGEWVKECKTLFPGYILIETDENSIQAIYEYMKHCKDIRRFLKEDAFF